MTRKTLTTKRLRVTSQALAGLVKKCEKMGRTGFEPVKAKPEDLQSSPVGHLGICPKINAMHESSRVFKAKRVGRR